jgi:hypothetical protein
MRSFDLSDLLAAPREDVLSIALDVDPTKPEHRAAHPAWRTWLRGALRDLTAALPAEQRAMAEVRVRDVLQYVQRERPRGRGLAMFAGEDLWRVFALPVPLRNHVAYGRPDVLPLLWAMDEYEPYAILAVSRERAQILLAYLGGTAVAETQALDLDVNEWRFKSGRTPTFTKAAGTGATRGAQRDTFDAKVDDHRQRFWSGAADAAGRYLEESGISRLVICGPIEAAHAVRDHLSSKAQNALVAIIPIPDDAGVEEIHRRSLAAALAEEHRRDRELVDLLTRTPAAPDAVVGVRNVLAAVSREQLQTLVVDRDLDIEVGRCLRCDTIHADAVPACPICGGPVAATPLAQVTPLLARRTGARLEFVAGEDGERLRRVGGIGGLLRYRVG